jgi:hypothetical protein
MVGMHLAAAFVLHRVLTFDEPRHKHRKIGWTITCVVVAASAVHFFVMSLNFHSAVFAFMIALVRYKTGVLIQEIRDPHQRRNAGRLSKTGAGQFQLLIIKLPHFPQFV